MSTSWQGHPSRDTSERQCHSLCCRSRPLAAPPSPQEAAYLSWADHMLHVFDRRETMTGDLVTTNQVDHVLAVRASATRDLAAH